MSIHRPIHQRILAWFTDWFGSGAGVWQTAIVTVGVVIFEAFNRVADPHAFILMAALTVYSAITQPALAHAGVRAAERTDQILDKLAEIMSSDTVMDTRTYELVKKIAEER